MILYRARRLSYKRGTKHRALSYPTYEYTPMSVERVSKHHVKLATEIAISIYQHSDTPLDAMIVLCVALWKIGEITDANQGIYIDETVALFRSVKPESLN